MVTVVRPETRQTKTVLRSWLLLVQVRNLLSRTTAVGENTLAQIDKGLRNQWIQEIGVYGLDSKNRCHAGLKLTIDWRTHSIQVALWGETVTVKQTVFTNNLAPEVGNALAGFTQAVIEECLTTEWRVVYPPALDRKQINRELGFAPCKPLRWAGHIRQQAFPVSELPELTVTFCEAVPEPEQDERKEECLFDRIKDAFG